MMSIERRDAAIYVNQLSKHYGEFVAVDKISFEIRRGEIFGFLGANGAGKTTAIKMLCGLLKPTSGEATVAGYNIFREQEKIKHHIGYMSQKFSLYEDLTVSENIEFYGGIYGVSKIDIRERRKMVIEELSLIGEENKLVASLPLGWKQKLAFSVALFHKPEIVFLDEPTSGVDPVARRQFWQMIYEAAYNGVTIFVTTHYMDEAEYCDRISLMVDGKIKVIDTPSALKSTYNANSIDSVFNILVKDSERYE